MRQALKLAWFQLIEPKTLRQLLMIILVVTLFLFFMHSISSQEKFGWENIIVTFVFTSSLSTISYYAILLSQVIEYPSLLKRAIILFSILTITGIIGTTISWFILWSLNIHMHETKHILLTLYGSNIIITWIVGSILTTYHYFETRIKRMADELSERRLNEEKLIRLKTQAEMESLKARVNPHFLFNTLNSIASLVFSNPALADDMIQKLSNLFRHALDVSTRNLIPLSKEIAIVEDYLSIESVRLGNRLTIDINIPFELTDVFIPPFLLQPLVENSIKHGIEKISGPGKISIEATIQQPQLTLKIFDNGKGFKQNTTTNGFGLKGVKERLNLQYGSHASVEIFSENGTTILLKLPLITEEVNVN